MTDSSSWTEDPQNGILSLRPIHIVEPGGTGCISAYKLIVVGVKIRDGLLSPWPRTTVEVVVERLVVTIGTVLPRHAYT